MKLKNQIFINEKFVETLTKIRENKKLQAKESYQMMRIVKQLSVLNSDFDVIRREILEKLGTKEANKDSYHVAPEKIEEFQSELYGLLETEIEIDYKPIRYPEVLALSPDEMMLMEDFFLWNHLE